MDGQQQDKVPGQDVEPADPGIGGTLHRPPDGRPGWQLLSDSYGPIAWYRPEGDGTMDAKVIRAADIIDVRPRHGREFRLWQDTLLSISVADPRDIVRITGV